MMIKKIKQISLSLACMIILLHAVIPHHHHSDKPVCFQELFHQFSDNHHDCCETNNHDNHNHDFNEGKCIIDDYFTPKDDNEIKTYNNKTYGRMSLHENPFDFNFITEVLDSFLKDEGKEFRRSDKTIIYKNPLAINNIGLRAPPSC